MKPLFTCLFLFINHILLVYFCWFTTVYHRSFVYFCCLFLFINHCSLVCLCLFMFTCLYLFVYYHCSLVCLCLFVYFCFLICCLPAHFYLFMPVYFKTTVYLFISLCLFLFILKPLSTCFV